MPITVTRLPDEPIIVAKFQSPQTLRVEIPRMFRDLITHLPGIDGPCLYVITDATRGDAPSFGDIVFILGESRVMLPHRRDNLPVRLLLVGTSPFLGMVTRAMGQFQYGGYHMTLFPTLDDALAAARQELAEHEAATAA